jgi:hypothetical protein
MEHASSTNDSRKLVFRRYTRWNTIYVADLDPGGTRITPPRHLQSQPDVGSLSPAPGRWARDAH